MVRLRWRAIIAWILAGFTVGCATSSDGVVQIGPDLYMIGGPGNFTDFSGSRVKGGLYLVAGKYCSDRGKTISTLSETSRDSGFARYASAEIHFTCLAPSDLRPAR